MVRRCAAILFCLLCLSAGAVAQNALPVLPTGDAAVAGFSGTVILGSPPPPEPQRVDKTYIDLDGPSLRVIGLARMGGPPQAQLVPAPKPFTATARQIGQVFSLALDDANPPNIYAAASSAYGLPIVVPDADGDGVPDRSRRGAPNAAFMPGLFGPITLDGGPGSIWKINGSTGAVTLFANVMLGGVPNSGPALGALAFDPASRQMFVADRDTGVIHRFTLDGTERGRFDHGTQALPVAGLPPIGFDPRKRLNIESPTFDSGNPATWAYAPPARRVYGMAVSRGRLYYAVAAGLRIWSVSILPDGSFGPDARGEVSVPRGALPNSEVSEILFDDNGDMLVAERGAPTGAYDYKALAESPENRVLRFRPKNPDDPPSRDLWFPVPKEYAIGFPPTYRNDNGGIAIGYGYDPAGNINRAVCGGTLWSTGEQLRNARDRAIIQRLQAGGPLIVDGLQGNSTRLLRPLNEPPFETYFIDYDDRFDDPQTRGTMGDVVIWRVCGQAALPLVPIVLICPPGLFDVDGACRFPPTCPAGTEFSNGCCTYRDCPTSYVRINGKCAPPPSHCKPGETYSEGRCQAPKCPAGMVFVSNDAAGGAAPAGLTAPNSGAPNSGALNKLDQLDQKLRDKSKMCSGGGYCKCAEGTQRSEDGTCKKSNSCGPGMVDQGGECVCDLTAGYQGVVNDGHYSCVKIAQCDQSPAQCCPADLRWNTQTHTCEPPAPRCDPSDPTTMVRKAGQCLCKDGSSPAGKGSIGGNNPIPGLPDGLLQSASSCCPSGRQLNPLTNKCDPGNPGTPHLTIVKSAPDSCTPKSNDGQVSVFDCVFTITITNDGTAPANDVSVTDQPTQRGGLIGTIVGAESPGWSCPVGTNPAYNFLTTATCHKQEPLRPGESNTIQVTLEVTTDNYVPNPNPVSGPVRGGGAQPDSVFNCAAIGTVPAYGPVDLPAGTESCKSIVVPRNPRDPPVTTCTPTRKPPCSGNNGDGRIYCRPGECSCSSGLVGPEGHQKQLCRDNECMTTCPTTGTPPIPPPPPPPPTITVTCPEGTRMGINGQCFFVVDPGCRGPNCVPVTTGCTGGGQRNSDGNCPTPTTCTGGKVLINNVCNCPANTIDDENGKCLKSEKSESRRPTHKKPRKPTTKPDSDNPKSSSPPVNFQIQIGPGFPGGRPGGHPTPTRPNPGNPGKGSVNG